MCRAPNVRERTHYKKCQQPPKYDVLRAMQLSDTANEWATMAPGALDCLATIRLSFLPFKIRRVSDGKNPVYTHFLGPP